MREDCIQSLFAGLRTARMDERSAVIAGAALIVASLSSGISSAGFGFVGRSAT
jgi:hypothetical protein